MLRKMVVLLVGLLIGGLLSAGVNAEENLMPNPGAEEVIPAEKCVSYGGRTTTTDYVPKNWGLYNSSGYCDWGSTDKEAHSGKRSAFMSFGKVKSRKTHFNMCLGGDTNLHSMKSAIKCEPDTTYYVSFWMKGDLPRISVYATSWTKYDESQGLGFVKTSPEKDSKNLRIKPTQEWEKYRGFITTKPDSDKFVVTLSNWQKGEVVGNIIYVDDVVIKKYVSPSDII